MKSSTKRRPRGGPLAKVSALGRRADKRLFGRRPELGLGIIGAAMIIGVLFMIMGGIAWALSEGLTAIFEELVKGLDFAPLLIHVPGIAGQPFFAETMASELGVLSPAGQPLGIFAVSTAMGQLYGVIQLVALVGLIVAAVVLGLTYVSEQFDLVSRGTAFQLFSESALVLVLLFIFPLIFNGAAAVLNGLNQQVILSQGDAGPAAMFYDVSKAAVTFKSPETWTELIPGVNLGPVLMTIIMATASFAAIFGVFVAGVARLLVTGLLVAAFPLILVLRLIPLLRGIATELQGALVGLLVGTLLVSLLFRVTYGILAAGEMGRIMTWAVGCGALITSTFMLFVVARGFGGLGRMMQRAFVGPAAGIAGGMLAMGGGFITGAAGGAPVAGLTAMRATTAAGALSAMGRGTLSAGMAGARGGPVGALTGAPFAAKEATLAAEGRQLLAGMEKFEGTPIATTFHNDFTGAAYQGGRARLTPHQISQEGTRGAMHAKELQGGRIPEDLLQREFAVAKFHPRTKGQLNRQTEVLRHSGIGRREIEGGLRDEYIRIKGSAGDAEANLWLHSLHSRAVGGPVFFPAGAGREFGK